MHNLALPCKATLRNGVPLYIIEGGTQDVVRIDMLMSGGYGVQKMPLQALFTNRMLREGTKDFSSAEIARRLDYYGAWIDMYSSQNCNHLTLYTLGRHVEPLLELVDSMLRRPLFPQKNFNTVRGSNKAFFKINSRKVDVVAQRHFEHTLWGEAHPLGHIVEEGDYDAITQESLMQYHAQVYGSNTLSLFLSGKINEKIMMAIERVMGTDTWGTDRRIQFITPQTAVPTYGCKKVHMDGALQSGVKIGFMAMDSDDADYLKFRFLTVLLGGYFGSRLMSNIREKNGYTYHIEAELDAYGKKNAFMISTETDNAYVEPLLKEVDYEISRLMNESVSSEELELVRNYTLGELCREYEGVMPKAEVFINAWLSGQPFDIVNDYLGIVRSVTAEELKSLAGKYLHSDCFSTVIVGA